MADGKGPDRLWTPWRMEYILSNNKSERCIFCDKPKEQSDRENLILHRRSRCFTILNRYPYNNGHLMVVPYSHVSDTEEFADGEMLEMFSEVKNAVSILKKAMNPEGFNIGMNLGKAAGAGIDDHMHIHIVPRWNGDTNFMPVLADVRVMPEHLDETYLKLYALFIKDDTGGYQ